MKTIIYRDKNKNRDCESSKKFHENKMRPVFSAFGNEKQNVYSFSGKPIFDHIGAAHLALFLLIHHHSKKPIQMD